MRAVLALLLAHRTFCRLEEGLWAKHRPVITPDHQLVASMASIPEGCNTFRANQIASANSAAIRRHFAELTAETKNARG